MLGTLLIFLVVLSLLVFVHEFGHFITAKKAGAIVEEFGFGFPPRLFGVKHKGTLYSVNLLPLGGFVKIQGENGEVTTPGSFAGLPMWKRAVILTSGVVMNMLLAMFLLSAGFMVGTPTSLEQQLPRGASIRDIRIQVIEVGGGSPAAKSGIRTGDSVIALDGIPIKDVAQIQGYNAAHDQQQELVTIERGKERLRFNVTPTSKGAKNGKAIWGVGLAKTGIVRFPWYQAVWLGMSHSIEFFWQIVVGFFTIFRDLFIHHHVSADLAGPVGIAVLTGQVAHLGLVYLLNFAALLSLNLAFINILPIPALDGGRVLFLVIEKIRGQRVSTRTESIVHTIGFTVLIALVLLITIRDVGKLTGSFSEFFGRLIR